MTYRGRVKDGLVVLEGPRMPPEGAPVSVRVLKAPTRRAGTRRRSAATPFERMKPFIGVITDLPADLSLNHDHYLYGAPRKA